MRKGSVPRPSKLKDRTGHVVDSSQRADVMAEYFERVQWAVRPVSVTKSNSGVGQALPICAGEVTPEEVTAAVKQLKRKKAAIEVARAGESQLTTKTTEITGQRKETTTIVSKLVP